MQKIKPLLKCDYKGKHPSLLIAWKWKHETLIFGQYSQISAKQNYDRIVIRKDPQRTTKDPAIIVLPQKMKDPFHVPDTSPIYPGEIK